MSRQPVTTAHGAVSPPTPERLLSLVDALDGQRVAMVADLVVDRFIHGTAKRISREAPVLILRHDGETSVPGGGANAVANVAALGGRPIPLGVVGDDEPGRRLLELFESIDVPIDGVRVLSGYRTPTKTRIVAGGRHAVKQQVVRYDIEDTLEPTRDDDQALLEAAARHAEGARAVVLSDYGYGTVHPGLVDGLRARFGDAAILGDSRYRLSSFSGLDGATPNLEEAEAAAGTPLEEVPTAPGSSHPSSAGPSVSSLARGGPAIRRRLGLRHLLITRGSSGMSLIQSDASSSGGARDRLWHLPVHGTDQVADVTGAGDTVIGTYALALAAGASPLEAACLANYAGGVVVMKLGTATVSPEELRRAIRREPQLLERVVTECPAPAEPTAGEHDG